MGIHRFRYNRSSWADRLGLGGLAGCLGSIVVMFAGWVTHIIVCLQNIDRANEWMIFLAGAVFFPVGIIHGVGYWFGIFIH